MSSTPSLSGPTSIPTNATHILVCLHGFGDEGQSYLSFAPVLNAILTQTPSPANNKVILGLAAPNGLTPTPMGQGYQWFSDNNWTFRDRPGIEHAKQKLWHYLQELSQTHHVPYHRIALLGFSQGGMAALYSAPRFPEKLGALITHSSCAMYQEDLDPATCQKVPTLLLHGEHDDVLPADQSIHAAEGLKKLGFITETHIIPDLAHGMNTESLAHIATFLATHLTPAS